ncbi:MAG: hypothetical protein ACI4IN_02405 [Eubacterium sp.]
MPKTLPIIITDSCILVKDKDTDEFKTFVMPNIEMVDTIPFYHQFAKKISECQYYFKEFVKSIYGKKVTKYVIAIIVPDDTSPLEQIFIKEFFLNSGACKGVAQMTMGQAISKSHTKYITISKSTRNVILKYINNHEVLAQKLYPINNYDAKAVIEDAKRLHIDVEYSGMPIFINNINVNMDDFAELGTMVSTKEFLDKIAMIDVEKA